MLEQIIGNSWVDIVGDEFSKPYLQQLSAWVSQQRGIKIIYPDSKDVFKALKLTPYHQVKVVIVGQDPYASGIADGLAFSYKDGAKSGINISHSLDVILHEIEEDIYKGFNVNYNYQLDYLAKQGVLLINDILTVERNKPESHAYRGWEQFTDKVIISQLEETSPKAFLLWGSNAKLKFNRIYKSLYKELPAYLLPKHLILESVHPASDLYNKDSFGNVVSNYPNTFTGCKHFSQANSFLVNNNIEPINWFDTREPYFNKSITDDYQPF